MWPVTHGTLSTISERYVCRAFGAHGNDITSTIPIDSTGVPEKYVATAT